MFATLVYKNVKSLFIPYNYRMSNKQFGSQSIFINYLGVQTTLPILPLMC